MIDRDDPRWTAYVLEEMSAEERAAFERELHGDAGAEDVLREVRSTSELLEAGFAVEKASYPTGKRPIVMHPTGFWQRDWVWNAGVAALFTVCAGALLVTLQGTNRDMVALQQNAAADQEELVVLVESPALRIVLAPSVETPKSLKEPGQVPDLSAATWVNLEVPNLEPPSFDPALPRTMEAVAMQLPLAADREALDQLLAAFGEGRLPQPGSVHVGDLVGAFDYGLEHDSKQPMIQFEVTDAPWDRDHELIWVQSAIHPEGTSEPSSVRFNPETVTRYRLLGANVSRTKTAQVWNALYEVIPNWHQKVSTEILRVYWQDAEAEHSIALFNESTRRPISPDFQFAMAAASMGLHLEGEFVFTRESFAEVVRLAENSAQGSAGAGRGEFVQALRQAKSLMPIPADR